MITGLSTSKESDIVSPHAARFSARSASLPMAAWTAGPFSIMSSKLTASGHHKRAISETETGGDWTGESTAGCMQSEYLRASTATASRTTALRGTIDLFHLWRLAWLIGFGLEISASLKIIF